MSFEVTLDVEGIEEFQAAMERLDPVMQRHVYAALHSLGSDMKAEAQRNAPVRTGRLRASIFARVQDWILEVGATAPYAWFQEAGTRFIRPRAFLWNAIQLYLPQLNSVMLGAVELAIQEATI